MVEILVQQLCGAGTDGARIGGLAAVFSHDFQFGLELQGRGAVPFFIILALAIDVRLEGFDGLDRPRKGHDDHVVHTGQCREGFGAQLFVEIRPARPLVDMLVRGNGDDQHLAQRLGLLQMNNVPGKNQIENSVRLHDFPAALPQFPEQRAGGFKTDDFRR